MNSPASLVDALMAQLQGAPLQQMAQQLGTSPAQTQDAVGALKLGHQFINKGGGGVHGWHPFN